MCCFKRHITFGSHAVISPCYPRISQRTGFFVVGLVQGRHTNNLPNIMGYQKQSSKFVLYMFSQHFFRIFKGLNCLFFWLWDLWSKWGSFFGYYFCQVSKPPAEERLQRFWYEMAPWSKHWWTKPAAEIGVFFFCRGLKIVRGVPSVGCFPPVAVVTNDCQPLGFTFNLASVGIVPMDINRYNLFFWA